MKEIIERHIKDLEHYKDLYLEFTESNPFDDYYREKLLVVLKQLDLLYEIKMEIEDEENKRWKNSWT